VAGLAADYADNKGKRGGRQDHAAGINADATNPFLEVVALSLEYKPLISEEGERDAEKIGEEASYDISIRRGAGSTGA
jgi:hypothetical protein